jgi:transcriptional regulator with XRE-family HTH domain
MQYAQVQDTETTKIDIKSMREKAGYTVRQMANKMKIDKAYYSRMERGIVPMTKERYNKFLTIVK